MIFPIFAPQIVGNVLYVEENKPKKMKNKLPVHNIRIIPVRIL